MQVRIPGFDERNFYEIERWQRHATDLPAVGDHVLVLHDDRGDPWVVTWWPG